MLSTFQTMPRTLRDLAGLPKWQHPAPGEAAVLLIDAQEEYRSGALALGDITSALGEIVNLRRRARELGLPVLHVRHVGPPGGLFDVEGHGGAFCAQAEPLAGEHVIDKRLPNAFTGTDLATRLDALSIKRIIVAGFMTHMCVSSTVRGALDLGLEAAVIADSCATRALPSHDGGEISARDMHRAALAAMSDRFACILPTSDEI
ncbi:cysteine hydrolase family protein [Breoghania sp.]|uniref:cysteine hydrolase family protein n=1 Tax=Breoghania sp. TaxID=2065378 RepID=UPI002AAB7270|nr:cysteine hydrolase family protein [Breoghania sp.]